MKQIKPRGVLKMEIIKINKLNWRILELANEDLQELYRKKANEQNQEIKENNWHYGFCDASQHTICINKYL